MEQNNQTQSNMQEALPPKKTKENLLPPDSARTKVFNAIKIALILLLSSFLLSFASYCLIEPNNFTIGGIAGIAIMVAYATNGAIPQSLIVFSLNMPLIILAFFFVNRRFSLLSGANILMQSAWLFLLEQLKAPQLEFDESTRIFAAIGAALCFGVAIALAFKIGGSSGGADILAVIIQKKFPAPSIAWMIFAVNAVIIGSSFFVFYDPSLGGAGATEGKVLALNLMPIALSLFESYIESKTNDAVTNGFQSAIEFRIITDKPEEMSLALMTELSRGVTSIPATGMYTKENHAMIVCVINRRQVVALKKVMRKVDPNAFAVMSNVSQVLGLGFYSSED